jgi:SnoaL-like domain
MTSDDLDRWLKDYIEAWVTYDRAKIEALFAEDVEYRYHPYDEPVKGRDAVIASWLGDESQPGTSGRDQPGTYSANYLAIAVEGDSGVATGTTYYSAVPGAPPNKVFDNCFVIRFDSSGRCVRFTEWYMERPRP